jgi:hypothetical protein
MKPLCLAVLFLLAFRVSAALPATGCDGHGNCYIRAGASGNGSGSDWTNAYTGFGTTSGKVNPASMSRGVTYWLAAGSYGEQSFNTPDSGNAVIVIRGATASSHGPASDWNPAWAGQAVFGQSRITTDNWTIDGQTRGSNWQSGYTIQFNIDGQAGLGYALGIQGSHVTIRYVEIRGSSRNYTYNSHTPTNCERYCDAAIATGSPTNNFYVGYSWLHDVGDTQFQSNLNTVGNSNGSSWIIEYNYISRDHTGDQAPGNHSEAFSATVRDLIVRYNYFQDIGSSGVITDASAGLPDVGPWYIYGNVVFWTKNNPFPGIGDGFVAFFGERMHGVSYIVGNTIANINNRRCDVCNMNLVYTIGGDAGNPTLYVENNLLWNVRGGNCYIPTRGWKFIGDYNSAYDSPGFNNCGRHAKRFGRTNPFASWNGSEPQLIPFGNLNFQLSRHTDAGHDAFSAVPPGCTPGVNCANVSLNGLAHGAGDIYDRGAMQLP